MSFGGKSRKEAKRQQEEALRMQRTAFDNANRAYTDYQTNFTKRNAGILELQKGASNWLSRFSKGEDVASLNPAFAKLGQETAGQVTKTMQFASRLGDSRTGDADYQAKLNSVASRDIAKGLARLNEEALLSEANSQRGILMDTSNFLNQDQRAGLGLYGELFGMTNQIFSNATTKRQMEIQRSQAMMNNFMGFLSAGLQTGLGVASMGTSTALSSAGSGAGAVRGTATLGGGIPFYR